MFVVFRNVLGAFGASAPGALNSRSIQESARPPRSPERGCWPEMGAPVWDIDDDLCFWPRFV